MAQSSFPFENIDTTETQYSQLFRTLNNGVNGTPDGGELEVDAASAGLAVDIAAGQAMVRGHFYISTEVETRSLAVADSSNDRIDLVVLRLDPIANTIVLAVKTGTPDAAPVAPALVQTDGGIFEQPLANVLVPAEAGVPSTITDRREFMGTKLGTWTTDGRPVPDGRALFGFNTTLEAVEFYDPINEVWGPVAPEINSLDDIGDVVITSPANGQSLVYDGTNWVNKFLEYEIEYLVVAGGGGGGCQAPAGARAGGGGGAGGVLSGTLFLRPSTTIITVGAGGNGGASLGAPGTAGSNTLLGSLVSDGGGRGGSDGSAPTSGGSGGGGGSGVTPSNGAAGISGQGFGGGNGTSSVNNTGGGGGGATGAGDNFVARSSQALGGSGFVSTITGSSITVGTGGASNIDITPDARTGFGDGGNAVLIADGVTNGVSGVIILKIAESATVAFSEGVTETNATAGGFTVYTITAAGPTDTVTIS